MIPIEDLTDVREAQFELAQKDLRYCRSGLEILAVSGFEIMPATDFEILLVALLKEVFLF